MNAAKSAAPEPAGHQSPLKDIQHYRMAGPSPVTGKEASAASFPSYPTLLHRLGALSGAAQHGMEACHALENGAGGLTGLRLRGLLDPSRQPAILAKAKEGLIEAHSAALAEKRRSRSGNTLSL